MTKDEILAELRTIAAEETMQADDINADEIMAIYTCNRDTAIARMDEIAVKTGWRKLKVRSGPKGVQTWVLRKVE